MNILPLVVTLLLVFAALCASFLRDVKSFNLTALTYKSHYHTDKAMRNALIKKQFTKVKNTPSEEPAQKKAQTTPKTPPCKRGYTPPIEPSKFYLKALNSSSMPLHENPLYEPLAKFLRALYGKQLFEKHNAPEGIEYSLIEAIATKLAKNPICKQLSELYPDDPLLKSFFYKMLKGTNYYSETEGIPPFAHFFSLDKSEKAIHINYSSKELLTTLFGEELFQEILNWEETQRPSRLLSAKEFEQLTSSKYQESRLVSALSPFISYSKHSVKQKQLTRRDSHTKLGIERAASLCK